jgi:hypothetical protein
LNLERTIREGGQRFRKQKSQGGERKRRLSYARFDAANAIRSIMVHRLSRPVIVMVIRTMIVLVDEASLFEKRV